MARAWALAILAAHLAASLLAAGCVAPSDEATVWLGTTTSVRDSGLLEALVTAAARDEGLDVRAVVGGTGETLAKGARGDVAVTLTHAPTREAAALAAGWTTARVPVFASRFWLVGPDEDGAQVATADSVAAAFARIAEAEAAFVSRADESGTHDAERAIWAAADIVPSGAWYVRSGSGQAASVRVARELGAYTLVDEPTWRALVAAGATAGLRPLYVDGAEALLANPYAVLVRVDAAPAARAFAAWLAAPAGQRVVAGVPAFTPLAAAEAAG